MKSAFKILKKGGRGVAVALHSHRDPGPETIYWSPQKWRDEGGSMLQPAGGFNSFCLVEDPSGPWRARSGDRVSLLSINGIGEIRWSVTPGAEHYGEGAVEHFGLKKWGSDE